MKPQVCEGRYDLDDVINPADLQEVAESLATVSGLSAGVVRMPPEGVPPPSNPDEFHLWRLTDVAPHACPVTFCEELRKHRALDALCMASDVKAGRRAWETGEPELYECTPGAVVDMVAPIGVAGQHVASIYIGRARLPGVDFDRHWRRIEEQLTQKGLGVCAGLRKRLEECFDSLPERDDKTLRRLKPLLGAFAELLSQRGSRHVALKVLAEVGEEIAGLADERMCVKAFYTHCKRMLHFDTGNVFLLHGVGKEARLKSAVLDWGGGEQKDLELDVVGPRGLVPRVAQEALRAQDDPRVEAAIVCGSRQEMEKIAPPKVRDSRDIRGIQSVMGVPIKSQRRVFGVLEVGSRKRQAFTGDDVYLLKAIASHLAAAIESCRDRSHLVAILSQSDLRGLLKTVADHLPGLTNATGCSIFLRPNRESRSNAVMLASSELPHLVGDAFYAPGEGFTGWVLETGRLLSLPGGKGARDKAKLAGFDSRLKWEAKYLADDRSGIDYRNRAFLAAPIRVSNGDIIGVIRLGARLAREFTPEEEETVCACADALGAVVERAGIAEAMREVTHELATLRSQTLAGQRTILLAIKQSPHAFVLLMAKAGLAICALALLLSYLFGLSTIEPGFSWLACIAFASYWLMGKVAERRVKRAATGSSGP
ncbi:MAG TPA: GAF domain-containing protein [Phycisphaerae bacterium]|nr:GAF domain-containing protein [Phycisphaerae bacterium]